MTNLNHSIELNRKHIAVAFIAYCQKQNKGESIANVIINSRKIVVLENLTEAAICNCLIHSLEVLCFQEFGRDDGSRILVETYTQMLSKDNSKLTPHGVETMTEVMKATVVETLANPHDNRHGLVFSQDGAA
ncbi:TPA: hypothetical protein ACHVKA_002328 [Yersinia enterocolitica]